MTDRIPFKKIDIDSKFATSDSKSTSNFSVQLPETCQLPDGCVFYIGDVCIPHAWKTIEEGVNDTLYLLKINQTPVVGEDTFWGYLVRLASNNYTPSTFATELQTRLRESTGSNTFTVSNINNTSGVEIQNTNQAYLWKLLTDDDLRLNRYPAMSNIAYDRSNLRSANDIIRNIESHEVVIGGIDSAVQTYESPFLNLNWINNIYISSPNLYFLLF